MSKSLASNRRLTLAASSSDRPSFHALEVVRTAAFEADAGPSVVFPLFGPRRERDWAIEWDPTIISRDSAPEEVGCVFTTSHPTRGIAYWMLIENDEEKGIVEYVSIAPLSHVARIQVDVRAHGERKAKVTVSYSFTGLTELGNAYIARHSEEAFRAWISEWQRAINYFLSTGDALPHESH